MFQNIPLTNVIIDNLHLFLRVSDVLINLLIVELKRQDAIEKIKTFSNFDVAKYRHLDGYQKYVSSVGVPDFQFYVGRTSKQLKCRTLTGPEKNKVFANICIPTLLPNLAEATTSSIQWLWTELLELNKVFSKCAKELNDDDIRTFEERARQWGRDFLLTYHSNNITPYIHAMMNHVSEFMTLHGSILAFTQQGLEKYNDVVTKDYFRSSNHKGEQALLQIMQKRNRLEHLHDSGVQVPKVFDITCSNCKEKGHNRLTCSKPCQNCRSVPYCAHLIIVGGHKIPSCEKEN